MKMRLEDYVLGARMDPRFVQPPRHVELVEPPRERVFRRIGRVLFGGALLSGVAAPILMTDFIHSRVPAGGFAALCSVALVLPLAIQLSMLTLRLAMRKPMETLGRASARLDIGFVTLMFADQGFLTSRELLAKAVYPMLNAALHHRQDALYACMALFLIWTAFLRGGPNED